MRTLILALSLIALPASAQVTTDDHALDRLSPAPAASPKQPAPAHRAPAKPIPARKPRPVGAAQRLPATRMPVAPPVHPVILPPAFVMPAHAPAPPPPVPVRPDAPGVAVPIAGGQRIGFGPGISDLNPATLAALRVLAAQAMADPTSVVEITAWAPGTPDDPSTPRRLSLDRGLAARGVLIQAGIVSDRIRTVAKGSGGGDYADVVVARR